MGRAQILPFGTGFLPSLIYAESYTDTVVLGDFGYEQVPTGALTITAKVSMKDVVVEDMVAEGNMLTLNAGNLQLNLDLANAERPADGPDTDDLPDKVSGYEVYTWILRHISPMTGEELEVGTVVMKYNTNELKLTLSEEDAPGSYSLFAMQEAGSEETLEDTPQILSFSVGPYGLDEVLLYVSGTASVFDKTVGSGDELQTFYGLARVALTGRIDSTAPVVTMIYPKPSAGRTIYTVTDRPITAHGTCLDAYGVVSVELQLNDGPFQIAGIAAGTWSLPGLELIPGTNTIVYRCTDQDGHTTTRTTLAKFSLHSDLTVNATGNAAGRVTSEYFAPLIYDPAKPSPTVVTKQKDASILVVTAVPGANSVFDGWISNKTLTEKQLASARLSFKHQPNMNLTAKFLINPFIPVRGRYNGLATGTMPEGAGFFAVTLASDGIFTGSFRAGTVVLKLKGKFSNTGRYTRTIKVLGVEYTIDLTLNVSGTGTEEITGTIRGGSVDVSISAGRAVFDKLKNPAPQAGTYNVIIPPSAGQPAGYPTGIGFGRVTVSTSDSVRFTGRTGTTPTFNAAARLSASGTWPFFGSLYGKRGSISGVITFDLSNPAHDLTGTLNWIKPANVRNVPVYTAGFTGQSALLGAKFTPPAVGQRLFLAASGGAGKFTVNALANATLPALQANLDATLGIDNRLTVDASTGTPISNVLVTLNPLSGMFFGSFVEGTALSKFTGIIVGPKLNRGAGFFRRGDRTGAVEIVAP